MRGKATCIRQSIFVRADGRKIVWWWAAAFTTMSAVGAGCHGLVQTHFVQVPVVLLLNKIDRLILELKLPPSDAYHKIRQVIEEINSIIAASSSGLVDSSASSSGTPGAAGAAGAASPVQQRLSPELGNVCFGSSRFHFVFTLESMARCYGALAAKRAPKRRPAAAGQQDGVARPLFSDGGREGEGEDERDEAGGASDEAREGRGEFASARLRDRVTGQ